MIALLGINMALVCTISNITDICKNFLTVDQHFSLGESRPTNAN